MHTGTHHAMSQEMQDCISNCLNCHAVCLETIHHCLQMGGEHASARHIGLLQDCAQICVTSADFMLRMSDYHPQTCGVCATVCEACAKECETMATGDAADGVYASALWTTETDNPTSKAFVEAFRKAYEAHIDQLQRDE